MYNMFERPGGLLTTTELEESAKRLGLTKEHLKELQSAGKIRLLPSIDAFWGYVIRDESLSRDVVRSVAYEANDYIDAFESTEQYLLFQLGAIPLKSGRILCTYGKYKVL